MIGEQKLFPLWKILSHQSSFKYPTNSGAYLVHWILCTATIIAIATPRYEADNFVLASTIESYGRALVIGELLIERLALTLNPLTFITPSRHCCGTTVRSD